MSLSVSPNCSCVFISSSSSEKQSTSSCELGGGEGGVGTGMVLGDSWFGTATSTVSCGATYGEYVGRYSGEALLSALDFSKISYPLVQVGAGEAGIGASLVGCWF